jgi:hypothetical protein
VLKRACKPATQLSFGVRQQRIEPKAIHKLGYVICSIVLMYTANYSYANEKDKFEPQAEKSRAFVTEQYMDVYLIGERDALRLIAPYPNDPQKNELTYEIDGQKVRAIFYRGNKLYEKLINPVPLFPKDRYESISGKFHLSNIPNPKLVDGIWGEKMLVRDIKLDFQSISLHAMKPIEILVTQPLP